MGCTDDMSTVNKCACKRFHQLAFLKQFNKILSKRESRRWPPPTGNFGGGNPGAGGGRPISAKTTAWQWNKIWLFIFLFLIRFINNPRVFITTLNVLNDWIGKQLTIQGYLLQSASCPPIMRPSRDFWLANLGISLIFPVFLRASSLFSSARSS